VGRGGTVAKGESFLESNQRNLFKAKKKQHNSNAAIKNNNSNDNYNINRICQTCELVLSARREGDPLTVGLLLVQCNRIGK
jgi:hypothetical protein